MVPRTLPSCIPVNVTLSAQRTNKCKNVLYAWVSSLMSTCSTRVEEVCVMLSVAAVNKAEHLKCYTYVYWHDNCKHRDTRGRARIYWNCGLTIKKQEVTWIIVYWFCEDHMRFFFWVQSRLISKINITVLQLINFINPEATHQTAPAFSLLPTMLSIRMNHVEPGHLTVM